MEKLELVKKLEVGAHDNPEAGMCVMEAVAYVAGEDFSDRPECVSPVIAAFCRSWNDALDDETRQRLKPYIPKLIGTRDGQVTEDLLAWMAADWLVRVQAPAWLRLSPKLEKHAEALAGLPELTRETAGAVQLKLTAARDAAWAAAGDAAWAAAGDAARDAARATAGDAAWDEAWAAAWDEARDAARDALKPTAKALQEEAFGLLDRMIAVAKDAKP